MTHDYIAYIEEDNFLSVKVLCFKVNVSILSIKMLRVISAGTESMNIN